MKKNELLDQITGLLGGRAAEEVEFDDITTGASNDIEKATSIARAMVTQYGMSERFGMMGLETITSRYLDGRPVTNCGERTEAEIDEEVKNILKKCHDKAKKIIEDNKEVLEKLAAHLIEKETITGDEFVEIFEQETGIKLKKKNPDGSVKEDSDENEVSDENENSDVNENSDSDENSDENENSNPEGEADAGEDSDV